MTCWCGENTGSASKHYKRGEKPCEAAMAAKRVSRATYRAKNRGLLNEKARARRRGQALVSAWVPGSSISLDNDEL